MKWNLVPININDLLFVAQLGQHPELWYLIVHYYTKIFATTEYSIVFCHEEKIVAVYEEDVEQLYRILQIGWYFIENSKFVKHLWHFQNKKNFHRLSYVLFSLRIRTTFAYRISSDFIQCQDRTRRPLLSELITQRLYCKRGYIWVGNRVKRWSSIREKIANIPWKFSCWHGYLKNICSQKKIWQSSSYLDPSQKIFIHFTWS